MIDRTYLHFGAPTRWARLDTGQARIVLALLAALLVACFTALTAATPSASAGGDSALYAGIVDAMRHGAGYYAAAAAALRDGGDPLQSFWAFPLPALALAEAALPPLLVATLLLLIVVAAAITWYRRLREAVQPGLPQVTATVLVVLSLMMFARPSLAASHEIWVGPLIALALALRRPGQWIEAVLVALIAMLIGAAAVLFALTMLALAWVDGARREAFGWAAAVGLFVIVLTAHAVAAGPPGGDAIGSLGLLGFGFAIRSIVLVTPFTMLPLAVAAPLIGLALFGWASWASPAGLRGIAILVVAIALLGIVARADTAAWVALIGPILPLGLVFVPDGVRDLVTRALDRRRITVTRIER